MRNRALLGLNRRLTRELGVAAIASEVPLLKQLVHIVANMAVERATLTEPGLSHSREIAIRNNQYTYPYTRIWAKRNAEQQGDRVCGTTREKNDASACNNQSGSEVATEHARKHDVFDHLGAGAVALKNDATGKTGVVCCTLP